MPIRIFAGTALALTLAAACVADEPPAATGSQSIPDHVEAAGKEVARESKAVGAAVKEGAVKVGAASKKVAHQVADATVKGAHEVKDAAKNVAAKTKSTVKKGDSSGQDKTPEP
ncbi:MAG: hypothetical protein ABSG29_11110 [Steroidobacteraceae bacterium]|jgi:hypothetical protein